MFLKRLRRRKSGKTHEYWALVETYRTARGPRHRVVAYLGELRRGQKSGWAQLGRRLAKKDRPDPSLFDAPAYPELPGQYVEVDLKRVGMERTRDFGDVWLALGLWRLLGLEELLERLIPPGWEEVSYATIAAILAIARFCEPSSELHIEDTWYPRTALDDLLGVPSSKVYTDRLYAGLDQLLLHKESIEKHLTQRLGDMFALKYDLLLYDITSTYFEGQCLGNPMAKRGYSRDQRSDCLQVCIGLIVTTDGMPLGYEVFDGNRGDSTTVQEMVTRIEAKYGRAGRTWVMDRGMVSEANLKFFRERGAFYIVGTPKAMLRQFERHMTGQDWQEVQAGVEVKLVEGEDGAETFILARSADRGKKEEAIHRRFLDRMEEGLKTLQASAQSGRLKDEDTANLRLGRLKERCWRSAGAFEVKIRTLAQPAGLPRGAGKARVEVTWTRNTRWSEWTAMSDGCYLLRTNLPEKDPAVLWKSYIQLTEAEWAFRITKDELEIRPVWHQKSDRVKAHILVCFLAYVMWKTLAQWMKAGGMGQAPRTLVEEFARIKSGDVVLHTRNPDRTPGRQIRLRCVTCPDDHQRVFLSRLGLTLPQRLREIQEHASGGPPAPPTPPDKM